MGHFLYTNNRNAAMLKQCDMHGYVQRTHHWSPLRHAAEPLNTDSDRHRAIFDTPKDRHIFPWVEVNARFGIISKQ